MSSRRWLMIGLIVALVAAVGYGAFKWHETKQYSAGTPKLSPELEAMRPSAYGLTEARPAVIGSARVIVRSSSTKGAWLDVTSNGGEGERAADEFVEVGTAKTIVGCVVAVLETHPGPAGDEPGTQTGSALVAVDCGSASVPTSGPPVPDTMSPTESTTSLGSSGSTR